MRPAPSPGGAPCTIVATGWIVQTIIVLAATDASGTVDPGLAPGQRLLGLLALMGVVDVSARRRHGRGPSGWWDFLMITVIGLVPPLVLRCHDGSPRSDRYGPSATRDVSPAV